MRKILADSGIMKTEMNPLPEIINLFKNDYDLLKSIGPFSHVASLPSDQPVTI